MQIEEDKEEAKQARKKESEMDLEDLALKEMIIPTAKEAQDLARAKVMEKQEQLCNISRALAVLSSASVRIETLPIRIFSILYFLIASHEVILSTH